MPFKSKAQMKWMFVHNPEMAKKWAKHTTKEQYKKMPERVKKEKK